MAAPSGNDTPMIHGPPDDCITDAFSSSMLRSCTPKAPVDQFKWTLMTPTKVKMAHSAVTCFESWIDGSNRSGKRLIDHGPSSGLDASSTPHERARWDANRCFAIIFTNRSVHHEQ